MPSQAQVRPNSKKPSLLPSGADLAVAPGMNMTKIRALFSSPHAFVSMCQIVREDESMGYMNPTSTQRLLLDHASKNRWVLVNKFRQAKITTVSVMLLLRDCMYLNGVKGLLIAERQDTAEDIFERILFSYHRMPADVRMPLAQGRKAGTTQISFLPWWWYQDPDSGRSLSRYRSLHRPPGHHRVW